MVEIFPFNAFEEVGESGRVGNEPDFEEIGDGGVAEIALPVAPVVVAHDGRNVWIVGDSVEFVATTGVDFGGIAIHVDTVIGETAKGLVDLDDGWEFPDRHKPSIIQNELGGVG